MRLINGGEAIPVDELVTAVFLVAITEGKILAIRNERGWDIPGGHVEVGENPAIAVARETLEEAGASFSLAEPFAVLSMQDGRDLMLFYTTSSFELAAFFPTDDALERAVMPVDEFKNRYCGPVEVLAWLIDSACVRLSRRE